MLLSSPLLTIVTLQVLKTYYVYPFLDRLKKWIARNKKKRGAKAAGGSSKAGLAGPNSNSSSNSTITGIVQKPENLSASSRKLARAQATGSNSSSGDKKGSGGDLTGSTIEDGGAKRWTADQMFAKNEAMIGRKIQYVYCSMFFLSFFSCFIVPLTVCDVSVYLSLIYL